MTVATGTRRRRIRAQATSPRHGRVDPQVDPVTAYAADVVDGRIVAGRLVRRACQRHLDDLDHGAERGLRWDADAAVTEIAFYPILRHYKGRWGPQPGKPLGDPVVLEPWQAFIVGCAFGWRRADGRRRFRLVYVEIGKKNGKTLMGAGVGIRLAFFDNEPAAEVYSAATKRDQAKLVWNDGVRMVSASPSLRRRIQPMAGMLWEPTTASKFQPLGADSDTDQGINVSAAIIDELHVHKTRDLVDNIITATAARDEPMVWVITTAGVRRESVWMEMRTDAVAVLEGMADDDSQFAYIATLDACDACRGRGSASPTIGCADCDDPFDESVWPKANPNIGVSFDVDSLREQAEAAKRSPGKLAPFLRFRMNVPTQATTRWLSIDAWDACAGEPVAVDGDGCYGGLDLASVRDLTALILVFKHEDVYDVVCRFWCPEAGVEERSRRDGVPYADWVRDGWLIATPGNVTDYDAVRNEAMALAERYTIGEIAFDRWNATQLVTQLQSEGAAMVAVSQTFMGLSAASKELDKAIAAGKVRHGGNPILRWMAGNVELEVDPQENIRPSKAKSTERIDGMVALVMAVSRWIDHGGEGPIVWTAA